jgi:hypothetical protein
MIIAMKLDNKTVFPAVFDNAAANEDQNKRGRGNPAFEP